MTAPRAILAIDQGTTSSRAMLFDRSGRPLGQAAWVRRVAKQLKLTSSLVPQGRPRKVQSTSDAVQ